MSFLYWVVGVLITFFLLKILLKTLKTALIITILGGLAILWWMMQQGMIR